MSSHQLSLDPDLSVISSACVSRTPVHANFSSEADLLAILWETGYIEYWDLKTRLGPGPGKVIDPVKIWSGVIGGDVRSWRQILVRSLEEHSVIYAIGASRDVDIIAAVKVDKDGAVDVQQRELPVMQSSRLISVHPAIAVQDSKGEIHECAFPYSSYMFSKAHENS